MEEAKDNKYCENCEKYISNHNFIIHSVHCQRNLEVCKICKETVPKKEMNEHIDEMHIYVSCDNCHQDIQKWKLDDHNDLSCKKRPILCKYCDLTFPWDEIEEHISYCGSRTEKCPKCQKFVPLKDQEQHTLSNCNMKVNSPTDAQRPKTSATSFNTIKSISPSEIRWDVNDVVLNANKPIKTEKSKIFKTTDLQTQSNYQRPKLILPPEVHQFVKSPSASVTVSCKYCDEPILCERYDEHQKKCPRRTKECPNCHESVVISEIKMHKQSCNKEKTNQIQEANKEVENPSPKNSSSLLSCEFCDMPILHERYDEHSEKCMEQRKECPNCHRSILMIAYKTHTQNCLDGQQNQNSKEPRKYENPFSEKSFASATVPCKYCDTPIFNGRYKDHLKNCIERKKECPNCCKYIAMTSYRIHVQACVEDRCDENRAEEEENQALKKTSNTVPCEYCDTPILCGRYPQHLQKCMNRKKRCPNCSELIAKGAYENHFQFCLGNQGSPLKKEHEEQKNLSLKNFPRTTTCMYCDTSVSYTNYFDHLKMCKQQEKECPHCAKLFTMAVFKIHTQNCCETHIQNQIRSTRLENLSSATPVFEITCSYCDTPVSYKIYTEHVNQCRGQTKECPYCSKLFTMVVFNHHLRGCRKMNTRQNQKGSDEHKDLSSTSLSDTVPCEYCDNHILFQRYDEHVKLCIKEKECPYCLKFFAASVYLNHLDQCFDKHRTQNQEGNYSNIETARKNVELESASANMASSMSELFTFDGSRSTMFVPSTLSLSSTLSQWNSHSLDFNPRSYQPSQEELLPCEFCGEKFHPHEFIQHETGCNPELTSLPSPLNNDMNSHSVQFDASPNDAKNAKKQGENMCISSGYHNLRKVRKTKGNLKVTFPNPQNNDQNSHSAELDGVPNGTEVIKNQMENVSINNGCKPKNARNGDISSCNSLKNDISRKVYSNQALPYAEKFIRCTFCDRELMANNLELHEISCKKMKLNTGVMKHNTEDSMDFQSRNSYSSQGKNKCDGKNAKQMLNYCKPNRTHSLNERHFTTDSNKISRDNETPNSLHQSLRSSCRALKHNTTLHSSKMEVTATGRSCTTNSRNYRATNQNQHSVKACQTGQKKKDDDRTGATYCPACKMECRISDVQHHITVCNAMQTSKGCPRDGTRK